MLLDAQNWSYLYNHRIKIWKNQLPFTPQNKGLNRGGTRWDKWYISVYLMPWPVLLSLLYYEIPGTKYRNIQEYQYDRSCILLIVITLLLGSTQCFIGTMPEGQPTRLCWFYYHWSIPDKFFRNIFFHLTNFCNDPLEGYIIFLDPSHLLRSFSLFKKIYISFLDSSYFRNDLYFQFLYPSNF